jgi:hypothetical protein
VRLHRNARISAEKPSSAKNPTESAIRRQTDYAGNTKAQVDELMQRTIVMPGKYFFA